MITYYPSIYIIDHPNFAVSFMDNTIGLKMVKSRGGGGGGGGGVGWGGVGGGNVQQVAFYSTC